MIKLKRYIIIIATLAAITLAVSLISLGTGQYPIKLSDMPRLLFGIGNSAGNSTQYAIMHELLFSLRLPRLLAGIIVGIALGMSGTTYQAMFRNPLISPEMLGVMGGALCGVTVGFMLDLHLLLIQFLAFCGGMLAIGITMAMAKAYKGDKLLILVLSGIITGAMFIVIFKMLEYVMDYDKVIPNIMPWLTGNLSLATNKDVMMTLPFFVIGIAAMILCAKALNALSLGEEAATLGINPGVLRIIAIISATMVASLTVSIAGIVAWVGLVVPHLGRLLTGHDNRMLLPVSALIGAPLLVLADDVSRSMCLRELPLGTTMSFIGIPVFLLLLFQARKKSVLI